MQSTTRLRWAAAAVVLAGGLAVAGMAVRQAAAGQPATGKAPALDAKFIKMSKVPKELLAGQVFRVAITMKNTGTRAWGPAIKDHVVVRSQAPVDNTTWGTHFIIQGQGKTCKAGAEFTFASALMAPPDPGEYVFQWRVSRMDRGSHRGPATGFGQPTPPVTITVRKRPPAASTAPAPATRSASGKKVLCFDDLEYAGSFKIPRRAKQDLPYSHSGLAIRKAADGTKRMFFNYTLPGMVLVEVEIPPLARLDAPGGLKTLKTAKVVKEWGRLTAKFTAKVGEHPKFKEIFAKGGFWWDAKAETLYWTWWHSYWCGGAPPILAASRLPEDGEAKTLGPWFVASNHKWYWGGVTGLPKAFADKYTGGRTLAMGYGTGYSGTFAGSLGPSLGAIDRPDPKKASVGVIPLLGYYKGAAAPRDGGYFLVREGWMGTQPTSPEVGTCTSSDLVRNGIFIDTPAKWGFIAFYRLQMGRIGYDYGAVTAGSYAHCWYFYDPDDLGAVAKGLRKPGRIVPRSRAYLRQRPGDPVAGARGVVTGSCFDPEENLLYVHAALCNGCIHAYRVRDPGPTK